MSQEDEKRYDAAMAELNQIIASLQEQSAISMTEYAAKAKRAKELLTFCQQCLNVMSEDLESIIK